jgi:hypothetical protein
MSSMCRTILVTTLLIAPALVHAEGADDDQGWSFSQRFQGTSNGLGTILKTNSAATYNFNDHVKLYAGVPIYFTRASVASGSASFVNGLGNVYSGLFTIVGSPSTLRYASDLSFTLPTGNVTGGFSTGHPTVDWTNTFSHSFGVVTPYASAGIANTISDTTFFVQPFVSDGIVSHVEAGALVNVTRHLTVGGSGFGIHATGAQQITTRSRGASQQTLGPLQVASDQGFSTWATVRPKTNTDLQVGYSRSVGYQLDTLFFGVGFHFGHGIALIK